MTMMSYKGYEAVIEFDDEAELFHGEVINLRDVITFQGASVTELKDALKDSVEDYLAFCKERGEEPEKPFPANSSCGPIRRSIRPCFRPPSGQASASTSG